MNLVLVEHAELILWCVYTKNKTKTKTHTPRLSESLSLRQLTGAYATELKITE